MKNDGQLAGGEAVRPRPLGLGRVTLRWLERWLEPSLGKRALRRTLKAGIVIDPNTGCHLWTGSTNKGTYGSVHGRVKISTHRLAYELAHGPIPKGFCVLHRCDNPACCNPEHLYLGTQADNMADMVRKGRGRGRNSRPRAGSAPRKRAMHVTALKVVREPRELPRAAPLGSRLRAERPAVAGRRTEPAKREASG
jgi:HNH endonuclease